MPGMDGLTLYREIKTTAGRHGGDHRHRLCQQHHGQGGAGGGGLAGSLQAGRFAASCSAWSTRRSTSRWSWSSMTTTTSANLWDLLRERGYRVCLAHDEPRRSRTACRTALAQRRADRHEAPARQTAPSVFRLVRQANPQARTVLITGLPRRDGAARRASAGRGGRRRLLQAVRHALRPAGRRWRRLAKPIEWIL